MPVGRNIQLCLVGMPLAVPISNAHYDSPFAVPGEDAHYQYLLTMPMMLQEGGVSSLGSTGHPGVKGSPAGPAASEIFAIGMGGQAGSWGLNKCFNLRPPWPGLRQLKVGERGRVAGCIN